MDKIIFVQELDKVFDETTGVYKNVDNKETPYNASVSNVTAQQAQIMYGTIKKRAIVVRNLVPMTDLSKLKFDYVVYKGKRYTLDTDTQYGLGLGSYFFSEI